MDLAAALAEQLDSARRIVASGSVVIPAWRLSTPEGQFLILTRFDESKPEQRERALVLIGKFMGWKLATAFVFTAEGSHRDDDGHEHEYLIGAGISRGQVIGARQRISRTAETTAVSFHTAVEFGELEPFSGSDAVDPVLLDLLPKGSVSIDEEEARVLASLFGEDGEMPAHRIN